ncbi:MAG TPA: nuclear transport factor 2 family protein [Polyangiaceae bacterium]|nr:nuclear transport factor 2 family protein [Polyangiaceae bacterium]
MDKYPSFSDETRIREDTTCWALAMSEKSVERVLQYYGSNAVTFGLAPPLQASADRASREAALTEWFDTWDGRVDIDIRNLRLEIGPERAFAFSTNHISGKKKSGGYVELCVRSTVGYKKVDGRWLIVHEHQSVPFDMKTLEACVDLTL